MLLSLMSVDILQNLPILRLYRLFGINFMVLDLLEKCRVDLIYNFNGIRRGYMS